MAIDSVLHPFSLIFQVLLIDLVLSGDNAVLIALACRSLPQRQMNQALMIGTFAAIGLRVLFTILASWLLRLPMLKLAGGVFLIVIAVRLLVAEEDEARSRAKEAPSRLIGAVTAILVADLVMSLDNAVALAAASQGNVLYLILGLLISVPLLMFGSRLFNYWLQEYPLLIPFSGALLGFIAGDIAVSDPAIAEVVHTQSPALILLVPPLCAVFVVLQARIIERRRTQLTRPAPLNIPNKPQDSAMTLADAADAGTTDISPSALQIADSPSAHQSQIQARKHPQPGQEEDSRPFAHQKEMVLDDGRDPGTNKVENVGEQVESPQPPNVSEMFPHQPDSKGEPEGKSGSMTAPGEYQENLEPANYFGLRAVFGNTIVQVAIGVILALFCIVLLPKILAITILIGMVLLMLFKVI